MTFFHVNWFKAKPLVWPGLHKEGFKKLDLTQQTKLNGSFNE